MSAIILEITAATVANEVRMLRAHDDRVIVVVEGSTDSQLFRRLLNVRSDCIVVAHGKEKATCAIRLLEANDDVDGYVAILDADFDRLLNIGDYGPNVLLTDVHDLDLLIFGSDALERVEEEFCSADKVRRFCGSNGADFRQALLSCVRPLGILRLISITHALALKFEGLNYDCFDRRNLSLDIELMLQRIIELTRRARHEAAEHVVDVISLNALKQLLVAQEENELDLWELCNGHDVITVFARGLQGALASRTAQASDPKDVAKMLRIAYGRDAFSRTNLYTEVQRWIASKPGFELLASE